MSRHSRGRISDQNERKRLWAMRRAANQIKTRGELGGTLAGRITFSDLGTPLYMAEVRVVNKEGQDAGTLEVQTAFFSDPQHGKELLDKMLTQGICWDNWIYNVKGEVVGRIDDTLADEWDIELVQKETA